MTKYDFIVILANQLILIFFYFILKKQIVALPVKKKYLINFYYLCLFPFSSLVIFLPDLEIVPIFNHVLIYNTIEIAANISEAGYAQSILLLAAFISLLLLAYQSYHLFKYLKHKVKKIDLKEIDQNLDKANIELYKVDFSDFAFSLKLIKGKVFISADYFKSFTKEELAIIIKHEIIHIERNDFFYNLLQKTISYFFFYNPVVLKINREIDMYREVLVDTTLVTEYRVEKKKYMNIILKASRKTQSNFWTDLIVPFSDNHTIIKRRIIMLNENLMGREKKSNYINILALYLLLFFTIACSQEAIRDGSDSINPEKSGTKAIAYSNADIKPQILKRVAPVYPKDAAAKEIEGKVTVSFVVNENGIPENLKVKSGPEELHKATLDAISQYRFKPALKNGKAVKVKLMLPLKYKLKK